MKRSSIVVILMSVVLAGGSVLASGCKSDEFSDAPSAKAPVSDAPARPLAANEELPQNHPPIGGGQASGSMGNPSMGGMAGMGGSAAMPPANPANYGKQGPILWTAPESWLAVQPGNEMRAAQYNVAGPEGEEPGELTVFYFGVGGGGGVDANLERWVGQLKGGAPAVRGEREIDGMKVYTIDGSGSFDAGMAMGGGAPKENQRVMGAIAETSAGLYFFKFVGPSATLAQNEVAYEQFLSSLKKGE